MLDLDKITLSNLIPIRYIDDKHILCKCSCGKDTVLHENNILDGKITNCGHIQNTPLNLTNQYFGEWYVDYYIGDRKWAVECSCGTKEIKDGGKLRNGYTKGCKRCSRLIDIKGKTFGELTVLKYVGARKWLCRCSCKNEIEVTGADLRSGHTKSCGHNTTKFKYITGQQFGLLKAIRYVGNQNWECECQCKDKTRIIVDGRRLRYGNTKSCGCESRALAKQTMIKRYGETSTLKIGDPREKWQIDTLEDKEKLLELIQNIGTKPSIHTLCETLKVQKSAMLRTIHRFNLENYIGINDNKSTYEYEILEYINSINPNLNIITNDRNILNDKELDIYIPEKKLAIEFNGNYWHSSEFIPDSFHQEKSIRCILQNIRLLHIYEYEWTDKVKQKEIKEIIYKCINNERNNTGYELYKTDNMYVYKDNDTEQHIIYYINTDECILQLDTPNRYDYIDNLLLNYITTDICGAYSLKVKLTLDNYNALTFINNGMTIENISRPNRMDLKRIGEKYLKSNNIDLNDKTVVSVFKSGEITLNYNR